MKRAQQLLRWATVATIGMGRKEGGGSASFADSWETKVAWAEIYFRTKWRLIPSSRLTTIDMGQNGRLCPVLGGGELCPHLAQCGLDQGPPPCH